MQHRDVSITIGLIGSLTMHTALALGLLLLYIRQTDEFVRNGYGYRRTGPAISSGLIVLSPGVEPVIRLPEPQKPKDPPWRQPVAVPKPPEPDIPDRFMKSQFGAAEGTGTAAMGADSPDVFQGRQGNQEQAWLSRDPAGSNRNQNDEPSPYAGPVGNAGRGGRPAIRGPGGSGQNRPTPDMAAVPSLPSELDNQNLAISPPPPKPNTPNVPFGVPAPALPAQPKLVARPRIKDIVAEAPAKPDNIIGQQVPVPDAPPSIVEGKSDKPNQLLVDARSPKPTTLPSVVVQKKPNADDPEEVINDPSKVTPPNMPRELAILESLLKPTTRPAGPAQTAIVPGAVEEGMGNLAVKGPTTRAADTVAMKDPNDRPENATVDKTRDAKPTTLPVGESTTIKSTFDPGKEKNDRPEVKGPESAKNSDPTTRPAEEVADASRQEDDGGRRANLPDNPELRPTSRPSRIAMNVPAPGQSSANPGPGGAPDAGAGLPVTPADPAPESDLESDAFSRVGNVVIRAGKVIPQLGREVKPIRPRIELKGQVDAFTMERAVVGLRVHIDAAGKVTDVKVLQSSGSNEIDLPTVLAVYKWWIEPLKDKRGRAKPDVIIVNIAFN